LKTAFGYWPLAKIKNKTNVKTLPLITLINSDKENVVWPGLLAIAASKGKATAKTKRRKRR
jgi:hypothetical protein